MVNSSTRSEEQRDGWMGGFQVTSLQVRGFWRGVGEGRSGKGLLMVKGVL